MEKKAIVGVILLVVGGLLLATSVQDMFQFRMTRTASVAQESGAPDITWQRTKGPGTMSNLMSTVSPGEKIKFCGKAKLASGSDPIYKGAMQFGAYEGVTDIKPEECWGKRMYCGNSPCGEDDLIAKKGFGVGRLEGGESTREKCFTINPQEENLEIGKQYHTILYIYDESYSLDKCTEKPNGYPTLAFDYWTWDYSEKQINVDIIKTGAGVGALALGAVILMFS